MAKVWISFYEFGKYRDGPPKVILECSGEKLQYGSNGMLIPSNCLSVTGLCTESQRVELSEPLTFEYSLIGEDQVHQNGGMHYHLKNMIPDEWSEYLIPLVIHVEHSCGQSIYFVTEHTMTGLYALRLPTSVELSLENSSKFRGLSDATSVILTEFSDKISLLSSRAAYKKWCPELELERKFTFNQVPDIWFLAVKLHRRLRSGSVSNFVPEPHLGFQVWDYNNYPYEVTHPQEQAGYISFIPQVDGRTTIKRKWFVENAEVRRESVIADQFVADMCHKAAELSAGSAKRLVPFNRTRFDVNCESLTTGHVYGIYFDVCTAIMDGPQLYFGQVELEYCRTRSLLSLQDVWPEFEQLAQYLRDFLDENGVDFEQNLYSKLDFARRASVIQKG